MNARSFRILVVVAVIAAVAAFFASRGNDTTAASTTSGQKLFPDLVVNDVAKVTVSAAPASAGDEGAPAEAKPVQTFVIEKQGDAWGAAEKGGYPIDVGKLKQLVLAIADMHVVAEMTKKPEGYEKLGLTDVDAPKSEAKRVTLADKSGKVVADLLIGKPKVTRNFGGDPSVYVRKAGDAQTYEVTGQISVAVDAPSWLDREIAKVESARVQKTTTTHTDGTQLVVSKTAPEDQNFVVEGLPEGKELMWPGVANQVAGALQYLNLEDVQKAEGFDWSGATITEFVTFDGLVVTAKTVEKDEKTWLALSASFDESKIVDVATVEAPKPEGEDAPVTPEPAKPARKTPDEVKAEVEALNKKVGPWVFAIPGYNGANFRKKVDDLLKKDEPVVPPEELELDGTIPTAPTDDSHSEHDAHDHGTPPTPPATPPAEPPPATNPPTGG